MTEVKTTAHSPKRVRDISWVAGILEGEGCFMWQRKTGKDRSGQYFYPLIELKMTDEDTVQKVADFFGRSVWKASKGLKSHYKAQFKTKIAGSEAIGWMLTIYPLMSLRRQAKIREIVGAYKAYEPTLATSK